MEWTEVVHIGELLDMYGELLSARPRRCMEHYYYDDYTLAEIAEVEHISRQAVHDNLQRAADQLTQYEERLRLVEVKHRREEQLEALLSRMSDEERRRWEPALQELAK